ncbi:Pol protein [Phytophthora palmivora]|uniref:Pol protein n=1 Tax=Phytophthora palmivora TaxID=4796 RepID=A0A2P4YQK7_9STRA|nr:Pol protein [Phytophthora palmivora]
MAHLAPVRDKFIGKQAAQLFLDSVFRYHGLSETIVSDRDPRFTGAFWDTLFQLLTLISRVRDAMASAQDRQKEYSDKHARGNLSVFKQGELVLLDTKNQPINLVSSVGSNKLKHRLIPPIGSRCLGFVYH